MKVRALCNFSGKVSMSRGDVREISSEEIIKDLMGCGYIEPAEENLNKQTEKAQEETTELPDESPEMNPEEKQEKAPEEGKSAETKRKRK